MKRDRTYTIETEQEVNGKWIAEVLELPGVMAYGTTREQAQVNAEVLAFRVLADEIEGKGDRNPERISNVAFSLS